VHDELSVLGWDDDWSSATLGQGGRPGRVVRVERAGGQVATAAGVREVESSGPRLAVGDWVLLEENPDRCHVSAVLPRRTVLTRASADRTSFEQVLAANVDDVVVVEPVVPRASVRRVERLLVLAWGSGARPLVVLAKADLVGPDEVEELRAEVATAAPGADVLPVSAITGEGTEELRALLGVGRTTVLLGASGAGKSSLVNALAGAPVESVAAVRRDGKGRHTTAWRHLVALPDGPVLIDTPGLRSVGLVGDTEAVDAAFGDVAVLERDCRFRDCGHDSEPGCAVLAAVAGGSLPQHRLDSWRRLQREAAWQERRGDARLMAAERSRWKQIHKANRGRTRP
jgi:ribosome biogenesis GTPase / thiamine phosphate phosphatase